MVEGSNGTFCTAGASSGALATEGAVLSKASPFSLLWLVSGRKSVLLVGIVGLGSDLDKQFSATGRNSAT